MTESNHAASLLKLRGISEDEKSENALLRSRIDEQSQLIMILKRRADESSEAVKAMEKQKSSLEAKCDQLSEDLQMHIRRCGMLEARFNDLASNHQQMIEFKDEYKRRNAELETENEKLKADNDRLFSSAIVERDAKIAELQKSEEDKRKHIVLLESECRKCQQLYGELKTKYQADMESNTKRLKELEKSLEGATTQIHKLIAAMNQSDEQLKAEIQKVTKEKEELLELSMKRGRVIQDKQVENKQLLQKIEGLQKTMKDLQSKYEQNLASVAVDREVVRLQKNLVEARADYESLLQEYESFKKHSHSLLQQEKELNERLRHIVS